MVEKLTFVPGQSFTATKIEFGPLKGTTLEATAKRPVIRHVKDKTAKHESMHVVTSQSSGGIEYATIIASGNALGVTKPKVMTIETAGAAVDFDPEGSSHDQRISHYLWGADRSTTAAAGRNALAGNDDYVDEVGVMLEDKKTIDQHDVNQAYEIVNRRKAGMYEANIKIVDSDGVTNDIHKETKNHEVEIHEPDLPIQIFSKKHHTISAPANIFVYPIRQADDRLAS